MVSDGSHANDELLPYRIIDLRRFLPKADEVAAWFDFATGLVGTSRSYSEAQSLLVAPEEHDLRDPNGLRVSLAHETGHFHQAVAAPFVYQWGLEWAGVCRDVVYSNSALIINGEIAVALAAASTPEQMEPLVVPLAQAMALPGEWGVSVEGLIESHSVFCEATVHMQLATPQSIWTYMRQFDRHIKYRHAYDLMRLWCGEEVAHRLFHAVVMLSLSTRTPVQAFAVLVRYLSTDQKLVLDDLLDDLDRLFSGFMVLGMPYSGYGSNADHSLAPYVSDLATWMEKEKLSWTDLLRDPGVFLRYPGHPTIVMGSDDDHKAGVIPGSHGTDHGAEELGDADVQARFLYEMNVAAVSQHLLRQSSHLVSDPAVEGKIARDYACLPRIAPEYFRFTVARDLLIGETELQFDEGYADGLIDQLEASLDASIIVDDQPRMMPIGRVYLTFDTERDGEVWSDLLVQAFIARLAARCPYLPIYLAGTAAAVMVMWFGSLVPAAMDGDVLNSGHPEVVDAVEKMIQSVEQRSLKCGVELFPRVAYLLDAWIQSQGADVSRH